MGPNIENDAMVMDYFLNQLFHGNPFLSLWFPAIPCLRPLQMTDETRKKAIWGLDLYLALEKHQHHGHDENTSTSFQKLQTFHVLQNFHYRTPATVKVLYIFGHLSLNDVRERAQRVGRRVPSSPINAKSFILRIVEGSDSESFDKSFLNICGSASHRSCICASSRECISPRPNIVS